MSTCSAICTNTNVLRFEINSSDQFVQHVLTDCCEKLLFFSPSWEQEQSKRRRKWRAENRKESVNKDESEKDSDSPESPPDSTETQEVAIARENLVTLMAEQKKIQRQKVGFPVWTSHLLKNKGNGCTVYRL